MVSIRPNVDIPWSIHGKIKHYAETQEISIEEAYIKTLNEGTDHLAIPETSEKPSFSKEQEWLGFGPREIESSGEESIHINNVVTCLPNLYLPDHGIKIGTRRQSLTPDELVSKLSALDSTVSISDDWFTLHQIGGSWVGRGLSNLANTIKTATNLSEGADFEKYDRAMLTYIGELPRESEFIFLRGEVSRTNGSITNFTLRFLTNGIPITGNEYERIASSLGFTELFNARDFAFNKGAVKFKDPVEVSVVDKIPREAHNGDPYVGGLLIENPFSNHPGLVHDFEWIEEGDETDREEAERALDNLGQYDALYTALKNHHSVSEDQEYTMRDLSATYISPIFNRNAIWNIVPNVNW